MLGLKERLAAQKETTMTRSYVVIIDKEPGCCADVKILSSGGVVAGKSVPSEDMESAVGADIWRDAQQSGMR